MNKLTAGKMLLFSCVLAALCGLVTCAQASIIYDGGVTFTPFTVMSTSVGTQTAHLDITGDTVGDIDFANTWVLGNHYSSTVTLDSLDSGLANVAFAYGSQVGSYHYGEVLSYNTQISNTLAWSGTTYLANTNGAGAWPGLTDQYLGVRFQITGAEGVGNYYYGWVELSVANNNPVGEAAITVDGFAYETNLGEGIGAGQTTESGGPAVPEPNSIMLMFSAAAAGLPLYRRFRKNKNAPVVSV